jgi:hypothetical protein
MIMITLFMSFLQYAFSFTNKYPTGIGGSSGSTYYKCFDVELTGNVVAGGGTSDINLSLTSTSLPTPIVDYIDINGAFVWSFKLTETSPDY